MFDIELALLVAILNGIALFLQKSGIKKFFLSPKWLLGTFLTAVSFFVYLLTLRLGGRLIVIQPIINVSILFLVILEIIFFKNKIKKYEILSLALFFLGLIIIQVRI